MSNSLYDNARQSFATGTLNWTAITAKVVLLNTTLYTVNLSTNTYYSDIPGGAIVAGPVAIGSPAATAGGCGGANVTFTAVSGATVRAIGIFEDTGTPTTSRLIAYIDTATGLPITPNGGDIILQWDTGVNKIFRV